MVHAMLAAAYLMAAPTPDAQSEPASEQIHQSTLFQAGEGGYHTYRIPALLVTLKGTVLAFCEGRKNSQSDSGNIDLLLRRSADSGQSWGPVHVVTDDGGNTCGNPCPILDRKTGAVVLLFTKNNGNENQGQIVRGQAPPRTVWVTTSADDGATWSVPVNISDQVRKPDWRWYATGPGHGIQLKDGRLIAPCDHSTGPTPDDMHSHVIFSDDGGRRWQLGGVLDSRTDESTVAELADGALYINMRSYRGTHCRAYAISHDLGMTWSSVADDETLVEPQCEGSVFRLPVHGNGPENDVLFSNPASVRREDMTVRLSTDGGKTWPVARTIWSGPAAYSDLAVTRQGLIACLYECGDKHPYEFIRLATFSLGWLTQSKK